MSFSAADMSVDTNFLAFEHNQTDAHQGHNLSSASASASAARHTAPTSSSPGASAILGGWPVFLFRLLALLFSPVFSAARVCVFAFPGVVSGAVPLVFSLVRSLALFLAETLVACAANLWERLVGEPFRRVFHDETHPVSVFEFLEEVAEYLGERAVVFFLCVAYSVVMGCIYAWRGVILGCVYAVYAWRCVILVWENPRAVFSWTTAKWLFWAILGLVWRAVCFCPCWVGRFCWNLLRGREWVPDWSWNWDWTWRGIWYSIVPSFWSGWARLGGLFLFSRRDDGTSGRSNHHDWSRGRDRTTSRACYGRTSRYDDGYDSDSTGYGGEEEEDYEMLDSYRPSPATAGARYSRRGEVADRNDCYERYDEQVDSYRPSYSSRRARGRREEEDGGVDSYRPSYDRDEGGRDRRGRARR
ncbi:hypothetical protein V8F20_007316 [Naviculisporaceae sp. PSN 640]